MNRRREVGMNEFLLWGAGVFSVRENMGEGNIY